MKFIPIDKNNINELAISHNHMSINKLGLSVDISFIDNISSYFMDGDIIWKSFDNRQPQVEILLEDIIDIDLYIEKYNIVFFELFKTEQPTSYHKLNDVGDEWIIDDVLHLGFVRKNKINEAEATLDKEMDTISSPQNEVNSWTTQAEEANSYIVDNSRVTPLIDALLVSRSNGETKDELVQKILDKALVYKEFSGSIIGKYHKNISTIKACTTIEELDSIEV